MSVGVHAGFSGCCARPKSASSSSHVYVCVCVCVWTPSIHPSIHPLCHVCVCVCVCGAVLCGQIAQKETVRNVLKQAYFDDTQVRMNVDRHRHTWMDGWMSGWAYSHAHVQVTDELVDAILTPGTYTHMDTRVWRCIFLPLSLSLCVCVCVCVCVWPNEYRSVARRC